MSRNTPSAHLYFIAFVLPEEGYQRVTAIKEYFRDEFSSKAALRSPPHITLHMPFRWPDKKLEKLHQFLSSFARKYDPFELRLQNFQAFAPKVIYIAVLPNPKLTQLQQQLRSEAMSELHLHNADYKARSFIPHVTVAFRDLKRASFHQAWKSFSEKEFHYQFEAQQIALLQHDGSRWQINSEFHFCPPR